MGNCLTCFQTKTNNNDGKASIEPSINDPRITNNTVDRGGKTLFKAFMVKYQVIFLWCFFAETDELLSESPAHLTSISTDVRNGSFKKSLVVLNGNTNPIGDIFSSGEFEIITSGYWLILLR